MGKYKYEIIFFDGNNQRYFEFYAFDRDGAIKILYELLGKDKWKKHEDAKILTFKEK